MIRIRTEKIVLILRRKKDKMKKRNQWKAILLAQRVFIVCPLWKRKKLVRRIMKVLKKRKRLLLKSQFVKPRMGQSYIIRLH